MQRRSGRRSHGPGLAGSVMPFPDLPSVPLFFRSLDGPRLIASLAPAQLALKGCATAQAKPCLPPLGGPRWYKSYFPPFLFLMQQISDWRELIGLRSSPGRGEWLGKSPSSNAKQRPGKQFMSSRFPPVFLLYPLKTARSQYFLSGYNFALAPGQKIRVVLTLRKPDATRAPLLWKRGGRELKRLARTHPRTY
jgi:hypothetical protein